jgi:eukaryotic-like serine/threonine-protein kinase
MECSLSDNHRNKRADGVGDTAPIFGGAPRDEHESETLPSDEPARVAEGEVKVVKICKACMVSQQGKGNFCIKCGAELVPIRSVKESCIGEFIGGKYKIVDQIGSGGMGEVYLGVNESLGQRVAVKFLSHKFTADERVILRFLNEARSYCKVNHPNAVTLLEYGQHDNGSLYLITEFIEGKSLTDTIKDIGPMSLEQIVSVGVQCCEVLSAAHLQGVIHRDLKPDNIMLIPGSRGRYAVKVLDFGIAKIIDDESGHAPMTETGSIFGTPEFMSPEQARGEGADPRSDLYAMGAILFFLVTAKLPFRGKNKFAVLNKHLNENAPRPSKVREDLTISPTLEAVILKCLNKRPEERYQCADDLAEALEECRAPAGSKTVPTGIRRSEVLPMTGPIGPLGDDGFDDAEGSGISMEWADANVDAFAPTMGGELSDHAWDPARLDSVDLSHESQRPAQPRRGPTHPYRRKSTSSGPRLWRAATTVTILLVVGLAAVWMLSRDGAVERIEREANPPSDTQDVSSVLLTGKVTGLLQAVERSIDAGELDGARESLRSIEELLDGGQVSQETMERYTTLVSRHQGAENLLRQIRAHVAAGRCDEARPLLGRLADVSKASAERMRGDVERCQRNRQAERPSPARGVTTPPPASAPQTPPPAPATTVSAPAMAAPKVEAPKVEAPKVEAPKVEAPKVEAPIIAPAEREEREDREPAPAVAPSKPAAPSQDDDVPDGMALPPRIIEN